MNYFLKAEGYISRSFPNSMVPPACKFLKSHQQMTEATFNINTFTCAILHYGLAFIVRTKYFHYILHEIKLQYIHYPYYLWLYMKWCDGIWDRCSNALLHLDQPGCRGCAGGAWQLSGLLSSPRPSLAPPPDPGPASAETLRRVAGIQPQQHGQTTTQLRGAWRYFYWLDRILM